MIIIVYHKVFEKNFKKLSPRIKKKFKTRLQLFVKDEFDPVLNNHALKGKFQGYRSINVTGDLRAVFKRTKQDAVFITIDSHSNLYH